MLKLLYGDRAFVYSFRTNSQASAMGPHHHEELPWHHYELKIRELGQKDQLDLEKLSSEFSKIIVSNLFLLNAGGIGSIPALSIFLDLGTLQAAGRVELLKIPLSSFGLGALLGLVTAFSASCIYQAAAQQSRFFTRYELSLARTRHPMYENDTSLSNQIDEQLNQFDARCQKAWRFARFFLFVSISCGILSLAAFIYGCIALSKIAD